MVTYRNRDPEPSVRFRPPHPLFKVFAVLFCCLQLLAVPAMAFDTSPVSVNVGYTDALLNGGDVSWMSVVDRTYSSPDYGEDYVFTSTGKKIFSQNSLNMSLDFPTSQFYFTLRDFPLQAVETGNSRYTDYTSTPQFAVSATQLRLTTSVVLPAGFYEADFGAVYGVVESGGQTLYRANAYSWFFVGSSGSTVVPVYSTDRMKQMIELTEPSTLMVTVSLPSFFVANPFVEDPAGDEVTPDLTLYWRSYNPVFTYRTLDSLDLAALDQANTDAGNSITDYHNVEQQWTGSMSENFAQLDVGGFSFGNGLISGFGLVSDLFMKVWNALGSYSIVYTFPLYLGIVLLLMGRVTRFVGNSGGHSGGHSSRKGK